MRQYLDLTTWVILFALLPVTVLILLSQNTIPGDFFYPVKRGMENIILVASSVSPVTKVAFRTDLTQRRFSEAQQLLVSKADTSAYDDFVTEISFAQEDLSNLSSSEDKIESSDKLIAKIEEYQAQIVQTQTQVQIAQALPQTPFQEIPQTVQTQPLQPIQTQPVQTSAPSQTTTPRPTASTGQIAPTIAPTTASQPISSIVPATTAPAQSPISSTIPQTPAALTPGVTNVIANNPVKAEEVKEKLKNTNDRLERAKEELKKEKEDAEFKKKVKEEVENRSKEERRESGEGNDD